MAVPVAAIPLLTRGISGLAGGIAGAQQGLSLIHISEPTRPY